MYRNYWRDRYVSETGAEDLVSNQAMSPDDFHDCIQRIREVASEQLIVPDDLESIVAKEAAGLLVDSELLGQCAAALVAGHVVLQGPPGTGKSSLARALARAFNVELHAVTAHEDWSTFEVIGRQELRVSDGAEEIVAVNGHFTEAVVRCAGKIPRHQDDAANEQATWLMIDELNRAHPDKAFGELFSVLGTDDSVDVILGHQPDGNNSLVVPQRFRIIATINSIDKQFVNSLSQGLRRRFTFITVDVPSQRAANEAWGVENGTVASREFAVVIDAAISRVATRTGSSDADLRAFVDRVEVRAQLVELFEMVESVRYAGEGDQMPFIPIGTAPMIDTVELFLVRSTHRELTPPTSGSDLDWAASVKLVPLFDAGMVNREKLAHFASTLAQPFDGLTRRAMREIASDGLYFVE